MGWAVVTRDLPAGVLAAGVQIVTCTAFTFMHLDGAHAWSEEENQRQRQVYLAAQAEREAAA